MISFDPERQTRALELATGNGLVARWLVDNGASVLATDVNEEMLEVARRREMPEHKGRITYRQLDATDSAALNALAQDDVTVSIMLARNQ